MPDDLKVNGVSLKTYAYNVENLAATLTAPGYRNQNTVLAGMHGAALNLDKKYSENHLVWNLWVRGGDPVTGLIPDGNKAQSFYNNVEKLTGLFKQAGWLSLEHVRPDGSVRVAKAEVQNVINWQSINGVAKVTLELVMFDPFWYDATPVVQNLFCISPLTGSNNNGWSDPNYAYARTGGMNRFWAATAPMKDLIIDFRGPFTKATLSTFNPLSPTDQPEVLPSYSLVINTSAASNEVIRVYTKTWTARRLTKTITANPVNLCFNPNFEYDTVEGSAASWSAYLIASDRLRVRDRTSGMEAFQGSKMLVAEQTGTGNFGATMSLDLGISPGFAHRISGYFRTNRTSATTVEAFIEPFNGITPLATTTVSLGAINNTGWTRLDTSYTPPATTTTMKVTFRYSGVVGDLLLIDAVMVQQSASLNTYYDGDTDDFTGWTHQPGNSPSRHASYDRVVSTGSAILSTQISNQGTPYYFELPPNIRKLVINGWADQESFGYPIPVELYLALNGSLNLNSGVSIIGRRAYLTG